MKRIKVLISGRVQGVSFRAFLRHKAILLGLNGYVKNISSGEVEAIFEGKDKAIDEIIKDCRKGPLIARIIDIKIIEQPYKNEFKGFEIRF